MQAKDGKAAIERVRRYLSVREGLLFHCRPGVENEVLAKIRRPETRLRMPPLPTRGPLQSAVTPRKPETSPVKRANAKPAAPQDASVPLPVQRKEPFRFPKSSNDS